MKSAKNPKKNENTVQQALKINNEIINDYASMTMFSVGQRGCFKNMFSVFVFC